MKILYEFVRNIDCDLQTQKKAPSILGFKAAIIDAANP